MPSTPSSPPYIVDGKTDAERYFEGCLDGTYVVCRHVKRLAEIMLPRFKDGYKNWSYDEEAALRPVRFIERFCRIPSATKIGQPFILAPYERVVIETAFGFVDDNGVRQFREVLVEWARKCGKGLSLDEELPTPDGWRKMGDLHVGDVVFGQDGKPSTIIAESEIFDKPTYLVTFEDGSTLKVTDDHIWTVQTKSSRRSMSRKPRIKDAGNPSSRTGVRIGHGKQYRDGGWFDTTTQEMFDDPAFSRKRADGKGMEYKYRVPVNLPVEYPEKDLPIDPYTFGYWIGDGSSSGPILTISTEDIDESVRRIESYGHTCSINTYGRRAPSVRLDSDGSPSPNPFSCSLKELGVLGNKHIPDIYMQASIEQRWELLRGLMDTDGYCAKNGECEFVQKSETIANQVVELCSSLGIKAKVKSKHARCNGVDAGVVYRVLFHTDKDHTCFHLKRKHDRLKDHLAPRMLCKTIISIERIPNEPTKCIAIDNPSHLYLAGRQYTATHNTSLLAALNLYMLTSDPDSKGVEIYNGASSSAQASLCYGATVNMVEMSPMLAKRIRRGKVHKRDETGLNYDKEHNFLCTISGNSKHLDGLSTFFAVLDELGVCEDGGAVYDLISESTSSNRSPLVVIISTENYVRNNIWDERKNYAYGWLEGTINDDRFIPFLYEMDSREEIYDERMWPKASPGLGITKEWQYIRDRLNKAKQSPARMPSVLTKDFNLPANSYYSFLSREECISSTDTFEFNPATDRYGCLGFDLASKNDLCSATLLYMRKGDDRIYERSMSWISEEKIKINSSLDFKESDGVPYRLWEANGWLRIVEGDKVDQRVIVDWIQELAAEGMYVRWVGYDKWHVDDWTKRELAMLVGEQNFEPIPQMPKDLSPAMKEHQIDLRAKRIVHNNNPVLIWARSNVQSRQPDANNNYFPQKRDLKPNKKIDPYISELLGYIELKKHWQEYLQLIDWYPPEGN